MTFSTCYGSKSIVAGLMLSDVNGEMLHLIRDVGPGFKVITGSDKN